MSSHHGVGQQAGARSRLAARALGAVAAVLVGYACWRGYQSPNFLLGVAAAFGLC